MSKSQDPPDSSGDEFEDDAATLEGHWQSRDPGEDIPPSPSLISDATPSSQHQIPSHSLQKRRRVTRACDECRRKKIKCDGKQPCTHCTVYSYECTYNQPSNRRRNTAPQYVESLEAKLHRAEAILKTVLPNVDLDDQRLSSRHPLNFQSGIKQETEADPQVQSFGRATPDRQRAETMETEKDSMLESMVENTGSLDLDDEGHWDFHGHSSGRAFLRKMRDQFGDLMGKSDAYNLPLPLSRSRDQPFMSTPSSSLSSPMVQKIPNVNELPDKACSVMLCANALEDACAILRFVHQPSFYAMLDRVYDLRPEDLGSQEKKFLPLLYSTIALGTLFATNQRSELVINGFDSAIDQGTHYFRVARSMMDVTDCRDLISLQTLLMLILFLQSSSRLSTCYSLLGIVLRSSIRMGLHRNVQNHFNPVEQEVRKRIFWCVRKLDTYVGALLGLPKMVSEEDIDQEFPLELDDEYITTAQITPMPLNKLSLIAAFNAHTRIVEILAKTVKHVYPIKGNKSENGQTYIVSHARIREIEQDLQNWYENLPIPFRPGMEAPNEFIRIQHLLRMAYAHIEMMVYRPFLHYVSSDIQGKNFDKRSYACAAACVSVSRNIVHLTGDMKRKGLLIGSYWFYMYTTFFAVISLVFFVIENPQSETSAAILRDAHEGKDTLAGLAKRSLAADRCSRQLAELFEQLPERLKGIRMNSSHKRRQATSPFPLPGSHPLMVQPAPDVHSSQRSEVNRRKAQTSPTAGTWQPPQSPFSEQQTQQQHIDPAYRLPSHNPYNSSDPCNTSSTNVTGSAPSDPRIRQNTQSDFSGFTSGDVPDLSAMMFPTSDPFAYPNQPMTTLENQNFVKQEYTSDLYSAATTAAPYQSFDVQLDMRNCMLPPNQQNSWGMPTMNEEPLAMSGSKDQGEMTATLLQQQQQQQQQRGRFTSQQGNYDQLFGEDWGGWISQGHRQ